jgi:hypothetical protein
VLKIKAKINTGKPPGQKKFHPEIAQAHANGGQTSVK